MEPGKIRLINSGSQNEAGFTQVITSGRSVDVYGASITVLALETLQLCGTFDAI